MNASERDCSGISLRMWFGLLCYDFLEDHVRHSFLNDLIRLTVWLDPFLNGIPRQDYWHPVMDKADFFTRFLGKNGKDRDLDTGHLFDSVKPGKPGDLADTIVHRINEMLNEDDSVWGK